MPETYINQEVQFLTDVFVENGQGRSFLKNLVYEYQKMKKENNKTKKVSILLRNYSGFQISGQN